jgi:hypothetical protein
MEVVHESERNRIRNDIRRLVLAQSDLAQAAMAAHSLAGEALNGDLCRALETAIVVCYSRPYDGRNKAGALREEWYPAETQERTMHDALLALRDQVYAHNDVTELRGVVDAGALLGEPGRYAEEWIPLNRKAMPALIRMCAAQQERFRSRVSELEREIAGREEDGTEGAA